MQTNVYYKIEISSTNHIIINITEEHLKPHNRVKIISRHLIGLFVYWHINHYRLFNAKAILQEEQ